MTTPFDEMGAAFAEALGRPFTLTIGGVPRVVTGIFRRRQPGDILPDGEMAVSGPVISFAAATSALSAVSEGDSIDIDGTIHVVAAPPDHDGRGMTRLTLQRG
jgi:hypothetical protein